MICTRGLIRTSGRFPGGDSPAPVLSGLPGLLRFLPRKRQMGLSPSMLHVAMQLDHTRIVVRERGLLDLLDLGLCVVRAYFGPLAIALASGILPAMLLNAWLLSQLSDVSPEDVWFRPDYMWPMLLLVLWEAPLVTAPATLYLGEAVFLKRPGAKGLVVSLLRALPQLFLFQVLLRGLMLPMVVTWFVPFALWPYSNEVILLERNPLVRRRPGQMTTFRRTQALHRGNGGELLARWMVAVGLGALLFLSLWLSMSYLCEIMFGVEALQQVLYPLFYPLALWAVIGYFAVVRFLGYLDLRIRREGWEVELMMRAEGARLSRHMT